MKKSLPKVTSFFCVTVFICLLAGSASAQCSYIAVSASNDTTRFVITNDFPIKVNTGNAAADDSSYSNAILQWKNNNVNISNFDLPTFITPGIKKIYFLIPNTEFDLFTDERKAAVKADPDLYIIL